MNKHLQRELIKYCGHVIHSSSSKLKGKLEPQATIDTHIIEIASQQYWCKGWYHLVPVIIGSVHINFWSQFILQHLKKLH
jgi:hypothetical protein